MLKTLSISALIWAGASVASHAQFTDGFTGEAALNGSLTTGNTETTDIGFGLKLAKETENWKHSIKASADYGKADGEENKNRYALGYQIDRNITEQLYGYGSADYFSDDFGAFKQGYFLGGGIGYQILPDAPLTWSVEAGGGYRSQKARLPLNNPTGEPSRTENEIAGQLGSDLDYVFNEQVSAYNDTELLYSASDTFITNEIGVTSQLFDSFALRASFRVEHHTDVPVGTEKTDTISRIGIVYTMK